MKAVLQEVGESCAAGGWGRLCSRRLEKAVLQEVGEGYAAGGWCTLNTGRMLYLLHDTATL